MRHLTNGVLAWALIVSCLGIEASQSQTKPANKIETGTVSGRVTVKGKGMPGIVVGLRDSSQRMRLSLKATTDEEGKYRITNVPAGAYQVAPIAPAFVLFDLSNSGSAGKDLLIAEGETVEGFDFALVRGGVITGRVTDADGRPVIEEYVQLSMENQKTSIPPMTSVQTDDRGIYRAFGVAPGQYRVSAGMGEFTRGRGEPTYRRTFHPSATDSAQATVVEVAEATEATNVDITLVRMPKGVSASGRVVDSKNGEPVANVHLDLTKITVQGSSSSSSGGNLQSTNRKGEFRAENLTPGKYIVSLSQQRESLSAEPVTFDVLDEDVTGLLIKTSVGASLAGIVVLEGSQPNSGLQKLGPLFIWAHVRDEPSHLDRDPVTTPFMSHLESARYSAIAPDGSFHLSGLKAGTVQLSVSGGRGIVLSRIEGNGVVKPDGILVQNDEQLTGLRVTVTQNSGTIHGQVKIENGAQHGGRLWVSVARVGEQSNMMSPEVDARGNFIADGLPSGSYEIRAIYMHRLNQGAISNKQLVTVADGIVSEVTITVYLNQNPRPTP